MKKTYVLLAVLLVLVVALVGTQATSDQAYLWTLTNGAMKLRKVTGLTRTSEGWAVPTATPGDTITNGQGIALTRIPGQPIVVSVDTPLFYLRVAPPSASGDCTPSIPPSSQQIMSHDATYMYVCVVTESNGVKTGRWGRTPLEFDW